MTYSGAFEQATWLSDYDYSLTLDITGCCTKSGLYQVPIIFVIELLKHVIVMHKQGLVVQAQIPMSHLLKNNSGTDITIEDSVSGSCWQGSTPAQVRLPTELAGHVNETVAANTE